MTSMAADVDLLKQAERHSSEDMSLVGCGNYIAFDIPSFYEESLNTSSMSASSNGNVSCLLFLFIFHSCRKLMQFFNSFWHQRSCFGRFLVHWRRFPQRTQNALSARLGPQ